MAAELAGAPDEVRTEVPGFDSAAAVAVRQRLEARSAQEEELMLRVPLSKQEAKKLKAQRRCAFQEGPELQCSVLCSFVLFALQLW